MTDDDHTEGGPAPARTAGRPRDDSIDERVLAVARRLLEEEGWDALGIRSVADRAGVGRASINRRWSSKAELALHAVLGTGSDLEPFAGRDTAGWIDWVVRGSRELFARIAGMLAELRRTRSEEN